MLLTSLHLLQLYITRFFSSLIHSQIASISLIFAMSTFSHPNKKSCLPHPEDNGNSTNFSFFILKHHQYFPFILSCSWGMRLPLKCVKFHLFCWYLSFFYMLFWICFCIFATCIGYSLNLVEFNLIWSLPCLPYYKGYLYYFSLFSTSFQSSSHLLYNCLEQSSLQFTGQLSWQVDWIYTMLEWRVIPKIALTQSKLLGSVSLEDCSILQMKFSLLLCNSFS